MAVGLLAGVGLPWIGALNTELVVIIMLVFVTADLGVFFIRETKSEEGLKQLYSELYPQDDDNILEDAKHSKNADYKNINEDSMLSNMIKNLNDEGNEGVDDSKNCTIIVNPQQVIFEDEENSGETEVVEGEGYSDSDECASINEEQEGFDEGNFYNNVVRPGYKYDDSLEDDEDFEANDDEDDDDDHDAASERAEDDQDDAPDEINDDDEVGLDG